MRYQATLNYSEPLLRRAVFAFWRRTVGVTAIVALVVVAAILVVMMLQGNESWMVGVLAAVFGLGIAFLVAIYLVHFQNSMQKLRDMGAPQAVFLAEESSFTVTSGIGSSTLTWTTIKEVWRFEGFWLLLMSKAQFITLPLAGIPEEMQSFVLHRVEATGGKVGV